MCSEPCVVDLSIDLHARDVLTMMANGETAEVDAGLLAQLNNWVELCAPRMKAQAVYVIRDVEQVDESQARLVDSPPVVGPVAKYLKPARRVVVFVVTIGRFVQDQADLAKARPLDRSILQSLGAVALDAAVDALMEHLWSNEAGPEEGLTLPVSPGSCGMDWSQNDSLYDMVRGSAIEVESNPLSSDSVCNLAGLAGIGPAAEVESYSVPCEHCTIAECVQRRGRRAK